MRTGYLAPFIHMFEHANRQAPIGEAWRSLPNKWESIPGCAPVQFLSQSQTPL